MYMLVATVRLFSITVITYLLDFISITSEYKCAPQFCHLFQKFAGNKDRLAQALEVQSLYIERCSCDQITLPGCLSCRERLIKFLIYIMTIEFQCVPKFHPLFQSFAGSKDRSPSAPQVLHLVFCRYDGLEESPSIEGEVQSKPV